MTDKEKLFIRALCVTGKDTDLMCTFENGRYRIKSRSVSAVKTADLSKKLDYPKVHPIPFSNYEDLYAVVYGIIWNLCTDYSYANIIMDEFDRAPNCEYPQYRIFRGYSLLRIDKDTVLGFRPTGQMFCAGCSVNMLNTSAIIDMERLFCVDTDVRWKFVNVLKYFVEKKITQAYRKSFAGVEILVHSNTQIEVRYDRNTYIILPEYDGSDRESRIIAYLVCYLILYEPYLDKWMGVLNDGSLTGKTDDNSTGSADELSELFRAYIESLNIFSTSRIWDEVSRVVRCTSDEESYKSLVEFLKCNLS